MSGPSSRRSSQRGGRSRLTSELLAAATESSTPLTEMEDPTEALTHKQMLHYLPMIVAQAMAVSNTEELMPKMRPEEVLNMKQELLMFTR